MPNTPAAIRRGITVAVGNRNVSHEQKEVCKNLLGAVGEVSWVENEELPTTPLILIYMICIVILQQLVD